MTNSDKTASAAPAVTDAVANARKAAEAGMETFNRALDQRVERLMSDTPSSSAPADAQAVAIPKVGIIAHVDHGKTALAATVARVIAASADETNKGG